MAISSGVRGVFGFKAHLITIIKTSFLRRCNPGRYDADIASSFRIYHKQDIIHHFNSVVTIFLSTVFFIVDLYAVWIVKNAPRDVESDPVLAYILPLFFFIPLKLDIAHATTLTFHSL